MKVILNQDVPDVGGMGEIVNVKDGFARNYLLPKGLAVAATERNVNRLEHERARIEAKRKRERATAEEMAAGLEKVQVRIIAKVGEEERLYGSVTGAMIAEKLQEAGFDIPKRRIQLPEPIRTTGVFTVTVKVHTEVNAQVKVWVTGEELPDDGTPYAPGEAEAGNPVIEVEEDESVAEAETETEEPTE